MVAPCIRELLLLPLTVKRKSGVLVRCSEDYEELGVPVAPSRPGDMFPDRWLGWDDYLGVGGLMMRDGASPDFRYRVGAAGTVRR